VITSKTYAREVSGKTERLTVTTTALPSVNVDAFTRPIAAQLEADGYVPEEGS
jgi:hypothetical protein